ncbi:MAG: cupin domain-containing protein [Balneolaceae bacterium]|nr:MAG: cupin domain-containing protein [Balneolaceae bacterium]
MFGDCPPFMPAGCGLGVLQGNPEEHNADVFLRLAPDSKIPMHWHTSAERMVLISGQMRVNYQGQPPVVLHPFTYAYGPAKLPHDAVCKGPEEECILFIAFEEPVDAIDIRGGNLPHR